ncbi:MAG: inner nuclear membrane protein enriched at telomere/subtelomere region [Chrysothrix sp. TS-e1954]|nr:MAG: inner nuclear membrane protein enriched at telomere/subtelomere region [Chrysothrix sp. TS-e1954]
MATSIDEDVEYLSPGFDPSSLTVPRLRAILVEYNIQYTASAKKPQLVEIFNDELVPKAASLLRSRARTTRSTRGIQDVPSSAEPSVDGDEDAILQTVEDTPRRSTRKTTSRNTSEQPSELPSRTPRKSVTQSARSSVDSRARVSMSADESTASTVKGGRRKTRHSLAAPIVEEEPEAEVKPEDDDETTFTSDNPFQSGSSPLPPATDIKKDKNRRRTDGPISSAKKPDTNNRRKTDNQYIDRKPNQASIPSRSQFEVPMTKQEISDSEASADEVEAGEDFTAEEQLELDDEFMKTGRTALVPTKRSKTLQKRPSALKTAPLAILLAMAGGLATLWRQEKMQVGYCGIGAPSTSIADVDIPPWADVLRPQCEPCPPHAFCYGNMITSCEPDFVLQPHPLSLGGLAPLPPTCEPDGEKARKVKAVADRAVEQLRVRNAKWECGDLRDEKGRQVRAVELDEPKLKAEVSSRRKKGMSQEDFEDLWQAALPELVSRDEVVSGSSGLTGHRTLRSTSTARIPLACALRRSVRLTLVRNLWKIVSVILLLGGATYARWSIGDRRATEARAKQLASFALDRLATQASLHLSDPDHFPEAYISMGQLRDDVLRDEFSSRRRQRLWDRVQRKVEHNSNVRPNVRESRSGEVSRVWEWVGAVRQIEDGRQSGLLSRSRQSLGEAEGGSQLASSPPKGSGGTESRRWDEGRPIY